MHDIERPDEVKARIIASALREFGRRGFAGASVREIAEGAGVTKPMIYYYFGNKEGLYSSLIEGQIRRLTRRLVTAVAGADEPEDKLRRWMSAYLDHQIRNRDAVAMFFKEVSSSGSSHLRVFRETYDSTIVGAVAQLIQEGIESGRYRPVDPTVCALSILGIANEFALRQIATEVTFDPQIVLSEIMDHYVPGLRSQLEAAGKK